MKTILKLSLFLAVSSVSYAVEETLEIPTTSPGYRWEQTGWLSMDTTSHGDGIAELDFVGKVVGIIDGIQVPLPDVRFSVLNQSSFASVLNSKIIFLSNINGDFNARLFVQAAMVGEGKNEGKVYQTGVEKIRIEKSGFVTREILFDYKNPKVIIHLEPNKKANKAEMATPRKPSD